VESKLGRYQAGFRPAKPMINQIFGLRHILEKIKESIISIHLLFIDFKSDFDSIEREQMYVAMNELNMPQKLIRLVKMMSNMQKQIVIQSKLSAPFIIHKDIRQGDAVARLLFNITLEYAIRKSGIQTRGTILYKSVQIMAYADDIVLIGRYLASMKEGFQLLEGASKEVGLCRVRRF
jgi:sorting nexin-29